MNELRNSHSVGFEHISEWNKGRIVLLKLFCFFFLVFPTQKRCLMSEDTLNLVKERNVHNRPVNCKKTHINQSEDFSI